MTRVIAISAVKIAYAIKVVKDTQGKGGEVNADMPSTVSDLLDTASLRLTGVVPWLMAVPSRAPGVYILSLSPDSDQNSRVLETAPIDCDAMSQWISREFQCWSLMVDPGRLLMLSQVA